jgi:hypothetical protein
MPGEKQMPSHSTEMSRSLERMRRDFGEAPTVRFVREARVIDHAYERTTEVYELPGWSFTDWSLAFIAAVGGLVTGFAAFVLLSTTQLAPDNGKFTDVATAVPALENPVASKVPVPEVVEAIPAARPEPEALAAPAVAPAPKADRDLRPARARKQRRHASLARAEARVRRAASGR